MEDNRKFATFFADAPKGKKIGAVLSWIATVILIVALFVPGYQLRYQMKTEKGTFKDIPATMTSELKQMKEAAKLNFQFGAGTTSDKIDEFVEKGSTSVFSYLVSPDLQKARLVNLETMSDAPDDISKICVALLVLFFVLVVAAAIASVFTISWCALAANLIGIIELLAVYFFVFAGKFSIDPTDTSITSRVAPALTMILIVLLVLAAIMSVASVIVSYAVHEDEEAFVDDWNSNDPSRDAETNLVDDGNATTVPATDNSMTVVASLMVGVQLHKPTAYHFGGLIVPGNAQHLAFGGTGVHQQIYDLVDGVLIVRAEPEQKVYLQRLRKIFFQLGAFAHPIRFFRIEWISLTHFSIILFSLITS